MRENETWCEDSDTLTPNYTWLSKAKKHSLGFWWSRTDFCHFPFHFLRTILLIVHTCSAVFSNTWMILGSLIGLPAKGCYKDNSPLIVRRTMENTLIYIAYSGTQVIFNYSAHQWNFATEHAPKSSLKVRFYNTYRKQEYIFKLVTCIHTHVSHFTKTLFINDCQYSSVNLYKN